MRYNFLLIVLLLSLHVQSKEIINSENHKLVNNKEIQALLSNYQNNQITIDLWNNENVIIRTSESLNKERAIFTLSKDNNIDCIFQSFYTYYSHIRIGRSVCNLNMSINDINDYQVIMEKYPLDTMSMDNPMVINEKIIIYRKGMDSYIRTNNIDIKYDDIFITFSKDGIINGVMIEIDGNITRQKIQQTEKQ